MRIQWFCLPLVLGLGACAGVSKPPTGLTAEGILHACPEAPHCVSSFADTQEQSVAPLHLVADDYETWNVLLAVLAEQPRTEVVEQTQRYARAEVTSPWGWYIDDLELLKRAEGNTVDIRSSSRVGYYDFNVNRERVEALRDAWARAGVLRP